MTDASSGETAAREMPADSESESIRLLYETSRQISSAMDTKSVVAAYLAHVAARGKYRCHILLYERGDDGTRKGVLVVAGWTPEGGFQAINRRYDHTGGELDPYGSIQPELDAGRTVSIGNVHTDPRASAQLRAQQLAVGTPSLAMLPLTARNEQLGLVLMSCATAHDWTDAELRPFQTTAAQLAAAIDSREQHARFIDRCRQLAVLEERQRLARDLHDAVAQLVFSASLTAQAIAPAWKRDPKEGERHVGRLVELSDAAHRAMRFLLTGLRATVRDGELATVLHHHAEMLTGGQIAVAVDAERYVPQEPTTEDALLRIAQEAVNNVVKHASARTLSISLRATKKTVILQVEDDGIGLTADPPTRSATAPHLGIAMMRERAAHLEGRLVTAAARAGRGTCVTARLPRRDRKDISDC